MTTHERETYANYRYYVEIDKIPHAIFTQVSGLQIETEVQNYEEGGNNVFVHRLPVRTKMGNLVLKRGITSSNEFLTWYMEVVSGKITRRNLSVVMYDTKGEELLRWDFLNAYPVKWVGPELASDAAKTAVETLELAHDG